MFPGRSSKRAKDFGRLQRTSSGNVMASASGRTWPSIIGRALAIWLILIVAEILHGIAHAAFLVPYVGKFRSNQIGVFTGSAIVLVIALLFVRWIGASRPSQLLMVGLVWLGLTVAFEILFGRM